MAAITPFEQPVNVQVRHSNPAREYYMQENDRNRWGIRLVARGLVLQTLPLLLGLAATVAALGARLAGSLIRGGAPSAVEAGLRPWLKRGGLLGCGLQRFKVQPGIPKAFVREYADPARIDTLRILCSLKDCRFDVDDIAVTVKRLHAVFRVELDHWKAAASEARAAPSQSEAVRRAGRTLRLSIGRERRSSLSDRMKMDGYQQISQSVLSTAKVLLKFR
eukprot:459580_1